MKLTWVNHASIILESNGVRLITDPWLEGTVFNHGWKLVSPTRLRYEDFATITHIWFSHEHPDHFFPPNLKRIPPEFRRRIKVLFHETPDKRLVGVCKQLGFDTQELPEGKTVSLAPDFRLLCRRQDLLDSWMAVFAGDRTVLNMNDCFFSRPKNIRAIKSEIGSVDVLLSQFSCANWIGNPDDQASQKAHAGRKLAELRLQMETFQPSWFIPFASFAYCSHAENFFMNESANRVGDVYRYATTELRTPTVVLYPGDAWNVGQPWDSSASIRKYECDLADVLASTPDQSPAVPLVHLEQATAAFLDRNRTRNNRILLRALAPSTVRLHDLNVDVELSFRHGIRQVCGQRPDIITSSDSLLYCLMFDWGGNTLEINGRYEVPAGGNAERFFRLFRVPQYNSAGSAVNLRLLWGRLVHRARATLAHLTPQQGV